MKVQETNQFPVIAPKQASLPMEPFSSTLKFLLCVRELVCWNLEERELGFEEEVVV